MGGWFSGHPHEIWVHILSLHGCVEGRTSPDSHPEAMSAQDFRQHRCNWYICPWDFDNGAPCSKALTSVHWFRCKLKAKNLLVTRLVNLSVQSTFSIHICNGDSCFCRVIIYSSNLDETGCGLIRIKPRGHAWKLILLLMRRVMSRT